MGMFGDVGDGGKVPAGRKPGVFTSAENQPPAKTGQAMLRTSQMGAHPDARVVAKGCTVRVGSYRAYHVTRPCGRISEDPT